MAKGEKPDYVVTGRVNGDSRRWVRIGAAWNTSARSGEPYISVRIQAIPLNWDGTMALHTANDNGDVPYDE